MNIHFLLIIFSIVSIEIFITFKIQKLFLQTIDLMIKIFKNFKSNESENIKEKLILENSKSLLIFSTKILIYIVIILSIFYICFLINTKFYSYLLNFIGILETVLIGFFYLKIRKFINAKL